MSLTEGRLSPIEAAGLAKCSTMDFPGLLSCVVFFRGCDLNCFYCHNRRLLDPVPQPSDLPWEQVLAFLEKRQGMLEGVVFSGGEPTLQPQLPRMMEEVRALGYHIKLDTNGQHLQKVQELAESGLVDYIAVDWKAPPDAWPRICGGSWERTRETIQMVLDKGIPMEARTTLYPGLTLEELKEMAGLLPTLPRWRLNLFRRPELARSGCEEWLEAPALGPEQLSRAAAELRALQPGILLP